MDFLYFNSKTGTMAEFKIKGIDNNTEPSKAIDIFLLSVCNKNPNLKLPEALLKLLSDRELDMFMLCPFDKVFKNALEDMVFVIVDNIAYDKNKNKYNVEYIGKHKTIISIDTLTELEVFEIPTNAIKNNIVDISKISNFYFTEEV